MSISSRSLPIRQYFQYINQYTGIPFFRAAHNNKPKLITELPEEILIHIAKNLLPAGTSDNNWVENIKNFQYACKLFFRIGFVVRDPFFFPFFNFDNALSDPPALKMNAWFEVTKKVRYEKLWAQLDALIMTPTVKPFDVYKVLDFLKHGHKNEKSLPMLIELGALEEQELQDLSPIKIKYLSQLPAFFAILKEKPDFNYFKKIPDYFLERNNYEMIYKAFKEDREAFDNMAKSKICLNYSDPCFSDPPFIQAVSHPTMRNKTLMPAIYPYIDVHACNARGENAVHTAARYGNVDALIFLHAQGVDCQKKNYDGWSPIFLSVFNKHYLFTQKLIEYGQSAKVRDKNENTILMAAAHELDIISLNIFAVSLIASGMPIHAVNKEGKNILHILFESDEFKDLSRLMTLIYEDCISDIKYHFRMHGHYRENAIFSGITDFINKLGSQFDVLAHMKDKYNISPLEFLKKNFSGKVVRFFKKCAGVV